MKLSISIIGGSGAGKSTLADSLIKWLRRFGFEVFSTSIGTCREIEFQRYKGRSRSETIARRIENDAWKLLNQQLKSDCIVLFTSTGLNPKYNELAPDITIKLKCSPATASKRATKDNGVGGSFIFETLYGVKTEDDFRKWARASTLNANFMSANLTLHSRLPRRLNCLIAFLYVFGVIINYKWTGKK